MLSETKFATIKCISSYNAPLYYSIYFSTGSKNSWVLIKREKKYLVWLIHSVYFFSLWNWNYKNKHIKHILINHQHTTVARKMYSFIWQFELLNRYTLKLLEHFSHKNYIFLMKMEIKSSQTNGLRYQS